MSHVGPVGYGSVRRLNPWETAAIGLDLQRRAQFDPHFHSSWPQNPVTHCQAYCWPTHKTPNASYTHEAVEIRQPTADIFCAESKARQHISVWIQCALQLTSTNTQCLPSRPRITRNARVPLMRYVSSMPFIEHITWNITTVLWPTSIYRVSQHYRLIH